MKQADGYLLRKVAEDYVLVPYGKRTEEVSQLITLSETAAFIYQCAGVADSLDNLVQMVCREYAADAAVVREDVCNVLAVLKTQGVLS